MPAHHQVFKQNPIFGVGATMILDAVQMGDDMTAHNAFVLCYTELGILGYWFWYSLIQLGIIGAWHARTAVDRQRPRTLEQAWLRRFAGMSVAAMGGYCASAYFLSRAFVYPMYFLFAILGAVPLVVSRTLPPGHPPLINIRRDLFLWCTVGAVFSILYIYFTIVLLNRVYYTGE